MVTRLEIAAVANGFIVRDAYDTPSRQPIEDAHVFNSWEDCSAYMISILGEAKNVRR